MLNGIRNDFTLLRQDDAPIYLDNACMSLKPDCVIDAMNEYYYEYPACGGRSLHYLSRRVTDEVAEAREDIATFIGCTPEELVFTRNTTEAINLVSYSLNLSKGDVVITSDKEHNSNLVPWQQLSTRKGVEHKIVPTDEHGLLDVERLEEVLEDVGRTNKRVLVSMAHTSNLDGASIDAEEVVKLSHDYSALVMLDGAQSVPHHPVNVSTLDVDLFAFSMHKMLGPAGIGCLFGKSEILEEMQPFITGGDTVDDTTYSDASFKRPPEKFEAGLGNYAGYVGAGEAVRYLKKIGMKSIQKHELELNRILNSVSNIEGVHLIGPEDPELRGGITTLSLEMSGGDAHDVALMLSENARIAVRSGAFCVHSWFNGRNLGAALRVSTYIYNTKDECNLFCEKFEEVMELLH